MELPTWSAAWGGALAALVAVVPLRAEAQPVATGLHWSRAESAEDCIEPGVLAARVEQLTGAHLSGPADASRFVEGHIERLAPEQYRARVTLSERGQGTTGHRVLEQSAENCRKLDDALVFIIAMMVDPNLSLAGLPPELLGLVGTEIPAEERLLEEMETTLHSLAIQGAPDPSSGDPKNLEEEEAEVPKTSGAKEEPAFSLAQTSIELHALALGELGAAPEPMMGVALDLSVDLTPYLGLMVTARGASGLGAMPLPESTNQAVRAQAFDLGFAACAGMAKTSRLRVRGCLGPEYSLWRQRGSGFDRNASALLSGLGITAALELNFQLWRGLGIVALGALRINTLDRRFVYDEITLGYSVPSLSLLLSAGPSLRF